MILPIKSFFKSSDYYFPEFSADVGASYSVIRKPQKVNENIELIANDLYGESDDIERQLQRDRTTELIDNDLYDQSG